MIEPRGRSILLVACLGLTVGCNSLNLLPAHHEKPEKLAKVEKDGIPAAPHTYQHRVSQFLFLSDFELKTNHPLFHELSAMRDAVYTELKLPAANTIVLVYVFEDRDRYERYIRAKYPELPKRRAFFVAQPRSVGGVEDLMVYTYWGDRVREDLRHELTHALLHSVLKDVPLWLDEGLAEYYEVPAESRGINRDHLDQIKLVSRAPFRPDLGRLEKLSQVQQMSPAEYREAWAWVHLMLRGQPAAKAVLLGYLQQLRTTPTPGPLQPRLAEVFTRPEDDLEAHLLQIEATAPIPPAVKR